MLNKIRKRSKEDKGNAIIMLGIMLIMALLLVGGMMLDLSKAYQLKSSYVDSARKATQAAIMEQTPDGYLRPEAAGKAIYVYENVARAAVINKEGFFSRCTDYGDDQINIRVTFMTENGAEGHSFSIKRSNVDDTDDESSIMQKLGMTSSMKRAISGSKYESLKLEVTEGTENIILPGAFAISQADEEAQKNARCQQMEISAKANVFFGETDQYN